MADDEQTLDRIVVGIPTATEPIHHMGDVSEPKHMTLVKLGAPEENPDLDMDAVVEGVRTIAESKDGPVTAPVTGQGPLGDDGAQVVFLGGDEVDSLHEDLLTAPELREGIGAVKQFPEFKPHVTLGYDLDEPVPDEDIPQEVIFDRLGVWDGDEHTEFPLGPSASTEETTEIPDVITGEEMGLPDEFLAELTKAMTDPANDLPPMEGDHLLIDVFGNPAKLNVHDSKSMEAACVAADQIPDELPRIFTRRRLVKRARELGCQYVIPREWLRQPQPAAASATPAQDVIEVSGHNGSDVPDLFQLKTALSALPDTALRAAYMRGVREYTMTAPQSRPPLPRDVVAQARVNSLIRLAQGDLSARTDDMDLLR
jgi:2'-5' RNA ligase